MSLYADLKGLAVTKHYKGRGRVGLIYSVDEQDVGLVNVQYGADGPFEMTFQEALRPATRTEVERAGLLGDGGVKILEET